MTERVFKVAGGDAIVDELTSGGWRQFTSVHFVASALLLSTNIAGLEIATSREATAEDLLRTIARVQMTVWLSLCMSWSGEVEPGRTLEGDLDRYVAPNAMLHAAADEFVRVTEAADDWDAPGRWCLEVIRASLLAWRGVPNPRVKVWADLFVENEAALRLAGTDAPPTLRAMEISGERARETMTYEDLFDGCARFLAEHGPDSLEVIDEIARKVGHPDLARRLVAAIQPIPSSKSKPIGVADLLRAVGESKKDRRPALLLDVASKLLKLLDEEQTPPVLDQVAEGLAAILGDEPDTRALLLDWLGRELLARHQSGAALSRIGEYPAAWEAAVTPHVRTHLEVQRSNSLRMAGRRRAAIAAAERALATQNHGEPAPDLLRNLAILYREDGQQERALTILLELLPEADGEKRLLLLHTLAVTFGTLGRADEAVPYLEEAAQLARGPRGEQQPNVLASLAMMLSTQDNNQRALELVRMVPDSALDDPALLITVGSTYLNVLQGPDLSTDSDRQRLSGIFDRLEAARNATYEAQNIRVHLDIVRLEAHMVDLLRVGQRNPFAELLDIESREFEGAPDPWALVVVARDKLASGDHDRCMSLLSELPGAVALRFTAETDMSLKVRSLPNLQPVFEHLVGLLVRRPGSLRDLRLVSELQRDVFGRIAAAGLGDASSGFVMPDDRHIAALGEPTAVLEWVDSPDGLVGLITTLDGNGEVHIRDQTPIGSFDIDRLVARVNQRLSTWHPGRNGDPFDLPEWRNFAAWLAAELGGHLPDGGRLVVIEHPELAGLQWHAAAAGRWRTSVAPSWSTLLRPPATTIGGSPIVGLAVVPRFGESPAVLSTLNRSAGRTVAITEELGTRLVRLDGTACDRQALRDLLASTTVAKVLCHGYVEPHEQVVAFMIAHDGVLPLANSVAASTPVGQAHRFDWRECQQLTAAPRVLFSAACSTGQAHLIGGDRLGLFSALRRKGTRTVVAPRWDISADLVLPILDDAMDQWLRVGGSVGAAVHAACVAASRHQPPWVAWALSVEGEDV